MKIFRSATLFILAPTYTSDPALQKQRRYDDDNYVTVRLRLHADPVIQPSLYDPTWTKTKALQLSEVARRRL